MDKELEKKNRKERLLKIKQMQRYGDIGELADMCQYSRVYVTAVLSPNNTRWNEEVVRSAEEYLNARRNQILKQYQERLARAQ